MTLDPKDDNYYAEISHYTRLLKTFPNNMRLLELRADCRLCHADWKRAAADYERLVKAVPDDPEYWGMLGQARVHGRQPEKAVAACTRAVELDPELELAYMHRGWAYRQLKQWDASIADYTRARELDLEQHKTMSSTRYRGELYLEIGEYEKAAGDFTLAIAGSRYWGALYALRGIAYLKMKHYENVIENANAFMDLTGEPWDYLLKQRVKAYKKLGQKEKACADLALIRRLEEKRAKENEAKQKRQEERPVCDSEIEKKAKERDEMIWRITGVVRINHEYAAAWFRRAECFFSLGRYASALRNYDKALSLDPGIMKAYRSRAWIYYELGEIEKEIADLEKIHELYPDDISWPVISLGERYEETGRYEQAVEFHTWCTRHEEFRLSGLYELLVYWGKTGYKRLKLRKLSAALSDNPANAALCFIRGKTYLSVFQCENAVADYTSAISLKPDFLLAYFYRALANSFLPKNAGRFKDMIADYTQVLKLDGTLPGVHSALGSLYKEMEQYEQAVACFNMALEIDPQFYEAYQLRSEVLDLTGNCQAAIDDLTFFLNRQENKSSSVLSCRGDIYFKIGDYAGAVLDYSAAIEQEKNQSWSAYSLTINLEKRGKCYNALHAIENAQADFTAAAELQKKDW